MSSRRLDSPVEKPKAASPYENPSVESNVESTHQQSSLVEYGPLPLLRGRVPDRSIRQGENGPQNMNISGVMSRASSAEDSGLSQSTTGQVAPETTTPQGSSNGPVRRLKRRLVISKETDGCHEWIEHPNINISGVMSRASSAEDSGLYQSTTGQVAPETTTPQGSSNGPVRRLKRRLVISKETDGCHEWIEHPNINISGVMSRASSAEDSGLTQSTTGQVAPETTTPQGSSNGPVRRLKRRLVLSKKTGDCHEWSDHPDIKISGVMSRASSAEDSVLSQSTTGQRAPETTTPQGSSYSPVRRLKRRLVLSKKTGDCHEWSDHPDIKTPSTSTHYPQQTPKRSVQDMTDLINKYQNRVFKSYGFTESQVMLLLRQFEQMSLRVQRMVTLPNHIQFAKKWDNKMEQEAAMKERQRLLFEFEQTLSTDSQSPVEETCSNPKKRRIEQNLTPQEGPSNLDKGAFEQKYTLTCCCCGYEQIAVVFTEVIQDQGPSTSDSTQDVFGEEKFFICSECGIQQEVGFSIQCGLEQRIPTSSEHSSGQSGDFTMAGGVLQHGRNTNGQERSHQEEMVTSGGNNQNGIGHEQSSSLLQEQQQAVQGTSQEYNSLAVYIKKTRKLHEHYLRYIHDALRDYPSLAKQQVLVPKNSTDKKRCEDKWKACSEENLDVIESADEDLENVVMCHLQNPKTTDIIDFSKNTIEFINQKLERVVRASKYLASGIASIDAKEKKV